MEIIKKRWDVLLILFIFLGFGIYTYLKGNKYREFKSFAMTKGVVIEKGLYPEKKSKRENLLPKISYKYEVNGKIYSCDMFSIYDNSYLPQRFSEQEAKEILNKYQLNQSVTVYYDEKNPENALLIKGSY